MRKRKAPIGAVFFLVLLLAIVAFFNMQGGAAGVYNPEAEQHQVDDQMTESERAPGPRMNRATQTTPNQGAPPR